MQFLDYISEFTVKGGEYHIRCANKVKVAVLSTEMLFEKEPRRFPTGGSKMLFKASDFINFVTYHEDGSSTCWKRTLVFDYEVAHMKSGIVWGAAKRYERE